MPKIQAWERLNNPEYCGRLTMTDFYELLLAAGYREPDAERIAQQRGIERLNAGVEM